MSFVRPRRRHDLTKHICSKNSEGHSTWKIRRTPTNEAIAELSTVAYIPANTKVHRNLVTQARTGIIHNYLNSDFCQRLQRREKSEENGTCKIRGAPTNEAIAELSVATFTPTNTKVRRNVVTQAHTCAAHMHYTQLFKLRLLSASAET